MFNYGKLLLHLLVHVVTPANVFLIRSTARVSKLGARICWKWWKLYHVYTQAWNLHTGHMYYALKVHRLVRCLLPKPIMLLLHKLPLITQCLPNARNWFLYSFQSLLHCHSLWSWGRGQSNRCLIPIWFSIPLSTTERMIEVDIQNWFGLDQLLPACIKHTRSST